MTPSGIEPATLSKEEELSEIESTNRKHFQGVCVST
jgi:hypothetical protein